MLTFGNLLMPYLDSSEAPDIGGQALAQAQRLDLISGAGVALVANAAGLADLVTEGDTFPGLLVLQLDTGLIVQRNAGDSAWIFVHQPVTYAFRAAANLSTGATLQALDFAAPAGGAFTESGGVFSCVTAGTYEVTLNVTFAANATSIRGVGLVHSVGPTTHSFSPQAVPGSIPTTLSLSWTLTMAAGETLAAQAFQNSGGNLSTSAEITFKRIA